MNSGSSETGNQVSNDASPSASVGTIGQRVFLGGNTPILQATADRLLQEFRSERTCDLRSVLVVLPGSMACRRLNEILSIRAESEGIILYPPKLLTIGGLPERLYDAKFPFATDTVQELVWAECLKNTPSDELTVLLPTPPATDATVAWLELGRVLRKLHRELASEQLNFADVAEHFGNHSEGDRWRLLGQLQAKYLERLDTLGMWDVQTARLVALEQNETAAYVKENPRQKILVVGCVDLNATQRSMLRSVSPLVEIWVAADQTDAHKFDSLGGLESQLWQELDLDIDERQLLVTNSPDQQAALVSGVLGQWQGQYHIRELTLGIPDSSLIGAVRRQLDSVGVATRHGAGDALTSTEPAVLLKLIAAYASTRHFRDFAALIRHPAVSNVIRQTKTTVEDNWLSEIDKYSTAVVPKLLDGFICESAPGAKTFSAVYNTVTKWLSKLPKKPRRLSGWVQPLLQTLATAYEGLSGEEENAADQLLFQSATRVAAHIGALRELPKQLDPTVDSSEIIQWLLRAMDTELVAEKPDAQSLEILGWLELALDGAPGLIVAGMHDGVVPDSINSDAFLPNSLRRQLGLLDNSQRFARDLYSMQLMLKTRRDVKFVVGRKDAVGDPLTPSRLLTACKIEQLPARVLHLIDESHCDRLPEFRSPDLLIGEEDSDGRLVIPLPQKRAPLKRMSVTAFRDYLACPYRFYLKHVLRLRGEDDATREMDAATFGVLVHETLDGLGEPHMCDCTDAEAIETFLLERLEQLASEQFGHNPPPAVLIQIEQARLRLQAFAPKQAARAEAGWVIKHVEVAVEEKDQVLLGSGDERLALIGRVDRIDYNADLNQWAIWDYKTSESAKSPLTVHYTEKAGWKDLQLPLYRHLASKLGVEGEPTLGYISVPKQATSTGFYPAEFTAEQLAASDAKSHEVASSVVRGEFWNDDSPARVEYDDFERICQSGTSQNAPSISHQMTEDLWRAPEIKIDSETVAEASRPGILTIQQSPSDYSATMIRASAGTGKTFQLSNRLLEIILRGEDVDDILATTFTRKAAGEILDRVLMRLASACYQTKQLEELQTFCGAHITAASCLAALRKITKTIHRLRISTLDSFFAQLARTFGLEMGLPPGWSTMDPAREPIAQVDCIARLLDAHDRQTLVHLVQMLAKGESTRQVIQQVRQTVQSGFSIYRSTTEHAWDTLPLPPAPSEGAIESALKTLESASLNQKSADAQLQKLHLMASIGDWENVIEHGIYEKIDDDEPTYYRKPIPGDLCFALGVISERAAAEILPARRRQTVASYDVLSAYDKEYLSMMKVSRQMAFSDVAHFLANWIQGQAEQDASPEQVSTLEYRLDCRIRHLLLDEFQDTAPEQWNVLRPLAVAEASRTTEQTLDQTTSVQRAIADAQSMPSEPGEASQASPGSFFCVGDTKQAIYSWRGGVAEIFDSVSQDIPSVEQHTLARSFRSSPAVIETVNTVFSNLSNHSNFSGCESMASSWSKNFPEHETALTDIDGYVRLQNTLKQSHRMPPDQKEFESLSFVANQIAELTQQTGCSVGVLFRTNAQVARMIGLLRQRGVSASQDGGNPLTDSAAVQLLLSLVHLGDHPGDRIAQFHVETSPLMDSLPLHPRKEPVELALWLRSKVARDGLARTLNHMATGISASMNSWDAFRVKQLIELAETFDREGGGRLSGFEEIVETQKAALPSSSQVKVMTVHKSKGLEFDAVFLPDLSTSMTSQNPLFVLRGEDPCKPATGVLRYMNSSLQRKLPDDWQDAFDAAKDAAIKESLCLLYVAMTRAKRALYMYARPSKSAPSAEFGSLLQSVLGNRDLASKPETLVYEHGNSHWYSGTESPVDMALQSDSEGESGDHASSAEQLPSLRLNTEPSRSTARMLQVTGPSNKPKSDVLEFADAFSHSKSAGAARGKLIHAFLQQITWVEEFGLDDTQLHRIARSTLPPDELAVVSVSAVIRDFRRIIKQPNVYSAIGRNRYRWQESSSDVVTIEIDTERPVNLLVENQLISGAIDRLAVVYRNGQPESAEIFDFKTDAYDQRLSLIWLAERVDFHRPQMNMYASLVGQLFGLPLEKIKSFLVMVNTDEIARIDHSDDPDSVHNHSDTATAGLLAADHASK